MASLKKLQLIFLNRQHRSRIFEKIENLGYLLWTHSVMFLKAPPIKGPKKWEIVPVKVNELISLSSSKQEIRNSVPQNYPWRFYKQYISAASFLP